MIFDPAITSTVLTYWPLGLATLALFVTCIYYNRLVELVNGKGDDMHYVAFEVVAGVAGVLIVGALVPTIGLNAILQLFILFAGAGFPMVWGYVRRHYAQARRDREMVRQAAEGKLDGGQAED